jgi:hypothetical protein
MHLEGHLGLDRHLISLLLLPRRARRPPGVCLAYVTSCLLLFAGLRAQHESNSGGTAYCGHGSFVVSASGDAGAEV